MRRALVALLLVIAAACGGGDDDDAADTSADGSTTSTTESGDEAADDGGKDGEDGEDGTTTTEAAGAPGSSATTVAASGDGDGGGGAPAAAGAPQPLPPGTYRYKQSGSASGGGQTFQSPPEGTAVVDAPTGDGRQTVHRYVDPEGEASDTTFQFGADGMFIVETVLRQGGTEIRCTFEPPLAAPPWPPAVGATFSGTGECGAFTAKVDGSITGTRDVELDGKQYEAFVIESDISTTGQFESKGTQVDWFVPELRVSAHQETNTTGKFGQISFTSNQVSDLISAIPS